ncbi:MAG: MFS transporter, partial [Clostridia bacterium]|nr:MFS transporter [Clostridia bacterium]
TFLIYSGILSVISYLITVFARNPVIGLMGCALCGLAVGMMWPGVISLSAKHFPRGGTAMFALIAFSGDCGASLGPGLVGFISEKVQSAGTSIIAPLVSFENVTQLSLKTSLLFAAIFPFIMAIVLLLVPGEKGTKK